MVCVKSWCTAVHKIWIKTSQALDFAVVTMMYNYYLQFVCDNAYHNTATIDEKRTFHCMSGIKIITPYALVIYDYKISK